MKVFVIIVIIIALFLLYRIAYPKPIDSKSKDDNPVRKEKEEEEVVGKSQYVCTHLSQPRTTPSTLLKTENQVEKAITFASETDNKPAIIPSGELDNVFGKIPESETFDESDLVIEDDNDDGGLDLEEEAEEVRQVLEEDIEFAGGFTYDEMSEAIKSSYHPEILYSLSKTDMFEQLVSGDAGRASRINAVLNHYEQSLMMEETEENKKLNNDFSNFDIRDFLN